MKKFKNYLPEIIISITLLITLFFLINPLGIFMPSKIEMLLIFIFALVFMIFLIFFWKEKPRDEREEMQTMVAGRIAFLTGSFVMAVGIVVQTLKHSLDYWLVISLATMIFAKMIAGIINKLRD